MKKTTAVIIALIIVLSLSACGGSQGVSQEQYDALQKEVQELQEQLEEKEESLSVDEQYIVDFVLKYTADFYNPSDVRVLQCGTEGEVPDAAVDVPYRFARLKIQGTNKLGGTLTQGYRITLDEELYYEFCSDPSRGEFAYTPENPIFLIFKESDTKNQESYKILFDKSIGNTDWWDDESIGRINRALAQHWEDLGIG